MNDEARNGAGAPEPEVAEARVVEAQEGADESASPAKAAPDSLQAAREEAQKYKDQLYRTAADFDNFKKRSRKDVVEAERKGREDFLRDLLPVFDNLERAVAHTEKASDVQAVAEGIRMVMKQFEDTLARLGVERVKTVGTPFDPAVHEAIQHLETSDYAPGTVMAEVQPGYRTPDRLVRPAMVVVAKARTSPETPPTH